MYSVVFVTAVTHTGLTFVPGETADVGSRPGAQPTSSVGDMMRLGTSAYPQSDD